MLTGLPSISPYITRFSISLLIGVTALVFSALISLPFFPSTYKMTLGELAPETIHAPRFLKLQTPSDKAKTITLKNARAQSVSPVKVINKNIIKDIQTQQSTLFTALHTSSSITQNNDLSFLTLEELTFLQTSDSNLWDSIEYHIIHNTQSLLQNGIETIEPEILKIKITNNLSLLKLPEIHESIIYAFILATIKPNVEISPAATKDAQDKARQSVQNVESIYKKGKVILYKNETVTKDHITLLKVFNLYGNQTNTPIAIGIFIITLTCLILIERFFHFFYQKKYTFKYFLMTFSIIGLILLGVSLSLSLSHNTINPIYYFIIPIPIISMVISIMASPNISLLSGSIASLLIAIMLKLHFPIFLFLFLSNMATTFLIFKKTTRTDLIKTGYKIGFIHIILTASLLLITGSASWIEYSIALTLSFVNGIVSSMITIALLPYIESIFQITTHQTLMELANLNHPLMKKLLMKAPGTYQHSLMVATLGESAAEAINADTITTRVGGYFHDIGKMKRPGFFTENQFSGENPHSTLSARMSNLIIRSHIKDGIELAETYKLPKILHDFILEHHGTSVVSFFYNKANINESGTQISADDFRYLGPKPSSKESGILMLADSIEAAVRSMDKPNAPKIENMINKIFESKLNDNQLDNCTLSFKEITTIKTTFLQVLTSMYHTRIDYTEELKKLQTST